MEKLNRSFVLKLDKDPAKPKYQKLADSIVDNIESGNFNVNDKIPSVNQISRELRISRETVFKAFETLSEKGIIKSSNRKGYYVNKTDVSLQLRVFMLLDKLTFFKEELFYAFQEEIKGKGEVDVFFHHHNYKVFESFVQENLNSYTHFVVVTFLDRDISKILLQIPSEKLVILDCYESKLQGHGSMIYQDFASNIKNALVASLGRLRTYKRLYLVESGKRQYAQQTRKGFISFAEESSFECKVIEEVPKTNIRRGDVYLTHRTDDRDLVQIIKTCRSKNLEIGKDVGLISYNDSPIKEVLEGGITVISTDFSEMGRSAARLILQRKKVIKAQPFELIRRNSL